MKILIKGVIAIFLLLAVVWVIIIAWAGISITKAIQSDSKRNAQRDTPSQIIQPPTVQEVNNQPETGYVNTMDSRGDIYNDRENLIKKVKNLDRFLDFSGNYDQNGDETDNGISGDDKYGLNVQIIGSKKHVKEVSFYYVPNSNYGLRTYTLDHIADGVKIVINQLGSDWSALHMAKILIEPHSFFVDSVIIEEKKMVMTYDGDTNTINLTIKHK